MARKLATTILTATMLALWLVSTLPLGVQATIYSDYERRDDYILWVHQYWELWLRVDTYYHTIKVKWNAEDWVFGSQYVWYYTYVKVWDDNGFDWKYPYIPRDGSKTITGYYNKYTWVYAEVRWVYYITPYVYYPVTLRCAVYVGA